MKLNIDDLRRHYASLSDEALRAINRTELVEIARECYDQELAQREPLKKKAEMLPRHLSPAAAQDEPDEEETQSALVFDGGNRTGLRKQLALAPLPRSPEEARNLMPKMPGAFWKTQESPVTLNSARWGQTPLRRHCLNIGSSFPVDSTCRRSAYWTRRSSTRKPRWDGKRTSKHSPTKNSSA